MPLCDSNASTHLRVDLDTAAEYRGVVNAAQAVDAPHQS